MPNSAQKSLQLGQIPCPCDTWAHRSTYLSGPKYSHWSPHSTTSWTAAQVDAHDQHVRICRNWAFFVEKPKENASNNPGFVHELVSQCSSEHCSWSVKICSTGGRKYSMVLNEIEQENWLPHNKLSKIWEDSPYLCESMVFATGRPAWPQSEGWAWHGTAVKWLYWLALDAQCMMSGSDWILLYCNICKGIVGILMYLLHVTLSKWSVGHDQPRLHRIKMPLP